MKAQEGFEMKRSITTLLLFTVAVFMAFAGAQAQENRLKPFVLASQGSGDLDDKVSSVRDTLKGKDFEIVGEYKPYQGAHVFVVTNDALKRAAAKSEKGAFGAVQRVAVTRADGEVQAAYTNPTYMANAYRMQGDLSDVAKQFESALGKVKEFGSEKGLAADKLRKYHYMFGMPYFTDLDELASYSSFDEAVKSVEAGLEAGKGGATKVYRVNIPGKQEALFGVKMTEGCSGDQFIMDKIDFGQMKHTPHLPYEILISGNKVYAQNARFRIAMNFPDLSMMGEHSFMKIMCAPDAIKRALTLAAGGKPE
jgi:hypothetical protein